MKYFEIKNTRIRIARLFLLLGMISGVISTIASISMEIYGMAAGGIATLLITPVVIWLSYKPRFKYLPTIFAVLVALGFSIGNAFTELYHSIALVWLGVVPLMYFYLTNRYLGLFFSAVTLLLYAAGYAGFEMFTGKEPVSPGDMGQGLAVFLYSVLLSWLYEKEWTGIEKNLMEDSDHDYLTGILNRRGMIKHLEAMVANFNRKKDEFSVIMFDIDNFKLINDKHGHEIGDSVLKEMSDVIKRNIRANDIFGRWGGEEFIIVCGGKAEGESLAIKLCRTLKEHKFCYISELTASFGVTYYSGNESISEIVDRADSFLYDAKKKKATVVCDKRCHE